MKILVAGAGGFIGGHLVKRLNEEGHTIRAVDIKPIEEWHQTFGWLPRVDHWFDHDLSQPNRCEEACDEVDWVFNLAADMGGMGFIESNKARCMLSVLINTNLLVAALAAGVQRYFFASSACVYPADLQRHSYLNPLRENDAYPADPEDGYGWEKLFSERMCRHFTQDFGLDTRVARYHNIYGPHGTFRGGREKAPAAICRKVAEAVLSGGNEVEIWGDGYQTRSFCYIDDCIEGTLRLMNSDWASPSISAPKNRAPLIKWSI